MNATYVYPNPTFTCEICIVYGFVSIAIGHQQELYRMPLIYLFSLCGLTLATALFISHFFIFILIYHDQNQSQTILNTIHSPSMDFNVTFFIRLKWDEYVIHHTRSGSDTYNALALIKLIEFYPNFHYLNFNDGERLKFPYFPIHWHQCALFACNT